MVRDVQAAAHASKHTTITRADIESIMERFSICLLLNLTLFQFVFDIQNYFDFK